MPASLQKIWTEKEREAWRLPAAGLTVSRWADENRIVGDYSAEPGPWQTSKIPCSAGIMDAFSDYEVDVITITGLAQMVKTECVFNMLGFTVDIKPIPSMYVCARDEDVEDICTDRLEPMFRGSPSLASHILPSPRAMRAGRVFRFDNMSLHFTGAQSAAALAAKAIGNLFLDETDKYPNYVGSEGSPLKLAVRRTTTFQDSKVVYLCTPTTKVGFIYLSYMRSNRKLFYVPCPYCGHYQVMDFFNLKVEPAELRDPDLIRESEEIYYECKFCKTRIYESDKYEMHAAGEWIPAGQHITKDGIIKGKPLKSKRHSGFWLPELLSPWPKQKWSFLLADWFESVEMEKVKPGEVREFMNQALGRTAQESGKVIERNELYKLKGSFSKGMVPADCQGLVAMADFHRSERGVITIDYEIRGFGYGGRNWVITTGAASNWDELDEEVLLKSFPWAEGTSSEKKPFLAVMVLFVDSGFEADEVYEYCRKRPGFTIPSKGDPKSKIRPLALSDLDVATEQRLKQKSKKYAGMQLAIIDTTFFKNLVTGWCEEKRDDKGNILQPALTQFYSEIPDFYFREFTNEHKVKTIDSHGRVSWVWKPVYTGAPTHSLDLAVGCAAAAYYKGLLYLKRPGERAKRPVYKKRKIRLSELQQRKRFR